MAAFNELLWHRIDVWAIVGASGLATIEEQRHSACRAWLSRNGYRLDTLNCARPIDEVVADLHRLLEWEAQFGYMPDPAIRNLNALRDGFLNFDTLKPLEGYGHVLELVRVDLAWQQEPEWISGLLAIAQEYSRWQLALGHRFFALLVVAAQSPMIGARIEESRVPNPFWQPNQEHHHFEW